MKKILIVFMMILVLTGCGKKEEPTKKEENKEEKIIDKDILLDYFNNDIDALVYSHNKGQNYLSLYMLYNNGEV